MHPNSASLWISPHRGTDGLRRCWEERAGKQATACSQPPAGGTEGAACGWPGGGCGHGPLHPCLRESGSPRHRADPRTRGCRDPPSHLPGWRQAVRPPGWRSPAHAALAHWLSPAATADGAQKKENQKKKTTGRWGRLNLPGGYCRSAHGLPERVGPGCLQQPAAPDPRRANRRLACLV